MGGSKSQMNMNTENGWLINLARNQNSLVVVARLCFCKTAGHAYHKNTSGFHQNVGEQVVQCNVPRPSSERSIG